MTDEQRWLSSIEDTFMRVGRMSLNRVIGVMSSMNEMS